jgi:branched-chain amino acid transport system permease protein
MTPALGEMVTPACAPATPSRLRPLLIVTVSMAILGTAAVALANAYWTATFTSALALALAASGVALLYGQLGLVSLCQYALLGVGGWVALRVSHGTGLPFEVAMLLGGFAAAAIGVLWGLPALRLRGLYLAVVTLMLAGAFQVVISATGFPDGGSGFLGRADSAQRVLMARPALATGDAAYLAYVFVVLTLGLLLVEAHRRTRPGRAWALIRKGEATAIASGVNLVLYKAWAFGLSGFLAGLGGALLAGGVGQLDGRAFAASDSILMFALTVVGGVYHWFGALLAGLLLRAVPSLLTDLGVNGYLAMVIFGAALLHALVTAPAGIAGQLAGLGRRLRALAGRDRGTL